MWQPRERLTACVVCKKDFEGPWHRGDKETCSNACRQRRHREKRAAEHEAELAAARDKNARATRRRKSKKRRASTKPKRR